MIAYDAISGKHDTKSYLLVLFVSDDKQWQPRHVTILQKPFCIYKTGANKAIHKYQ